MVHQVQDVNDNMKTTRTILLGMSRRVITNKIILVLIILLLIASIGVIIYLKWGRGLINQIS
jgi:cell division protein FtsL